ncbi:hypothetical protein [Armatimonas sp.]|uniref:hypothetical protein n=1 Tax=Armatimonas sp. TaxID=1872638 RepID=UPI003751D127
MYELRIDKKISRRAALQGILFGAVTFSAIAFFVQPLIVPIEITGKATVFRGPKKGEQKSFGLDRGTTSVLFGLLGGILGFSLSKGFASDIQRRKALKDLIEQGKKHS